MRLSLKVNFEIPYQEHKINVEVTQFNHVSIRLDGEQIFAKRFIRKGLKHGFTWQGRWFDIEIKALGFFIPGVMCTVRVDDEHYYEDELGFERFGDASNFKKIRHGIWFYFNVGDDTIAHHSSLTNGMETFYLNEEEIHKTRNLTSRTGEYSFPLKNHIYRVVIKVTDVFKGTAQCQLFEDEKLLETQIGGLTFHETNGKFDWKAFLTAFTAGFLTFGILGYIVGYSVAKVLLA